MNTTEQASKTEEKKCSIKENLIANLLFWLAVVVLSFLAGFLIHYP